MEDFEYKIALQKPRENSRDPDNTRWSPRERQKRRCEPTRNSRRARRISREPKTSPESPQEPPSKAQESPRKPPRTAQESPRELQKEAQERPQEPKREPCRHLCDPTGFPPPEPCKHFCYESSSFYSLVPPFHNPSFYLNKTYF